ncbi:MAG TPA: hypothetical protein VIT62_08950, partial [Lysobacter sp.]
FAADSQCSGDAHVVRVSKLFRLPCGGVAAGCGSFPEIVRAIQWLKAGSKGKPPKMKASEIMVAYPDGRTGVYISWIFTEVNGPCAIGSGTQAAMAAMVHYEASALEAVKASASVDPNTSGPFQVMRVEPKAKRKSSARKGK